MKRRNNLRYHLQDLVNPQASHAHPCADTHGGNQQLLLLPPHFCQTSNNLSGAGGSQGVAESNRASPGVDLGVVETELLYTVHRHAGKGLVQLVKVDVVDGEIELFEELGHNDGRTDTHDPRGQSGYGGTAELCEDRLTKLLGGGTLHQQNCRCAVGDLRRVPASALVAPLGESGADLAERFVSGSVSDAVVRGDCDLLLLASLGILPRGGDGDDFLVEQTRLLRALGTLVGLRRVPILRLAGNIEVIPYVLRGLSHGLHAVGGVLVSVDNGIREQGCWLVDVGAHHLNAAGNANVDAAATDLVRDVVDGKKSGGAKAVARAGGGGVWEASCDGGGAKQVGYAVRVDIATADILDDGWVDFGLGDELLQELVEHDVDGSIFQAALRFYMSCAALDPPVNMQHTLKALVRGVRMAHVRTISSAFLEVLQWLSVRAQS